MLDVVMTVIIHVVSFTEARNFSHMCLDTVSDCPHIFLSLSQTAHTYSYHCLRLPIFLSLSHTAHTYSYHCLRLPTHILITVSDCQHIFLSLSQTAHTYSYHCLRLPTHILITVSDCPHIFLSLWGRLSVTDPSFREVETFLPEELISCL
jgi:hypothetical protein